MPGRCVRFGSRPRKLPVSGKVLLQTFFDGAPAFGLVGGATDPDDQATRLAPAAAYREQDFCIRRLTVCWRHRDDVWQEIVLHGDGGGDSPHLCQ